MTCSFKDTMQLEQASSRRLRGSLWPEWVLSGTDSQKAASEIAAPRWVGPHNAPRPKNMASIRVRIEGWRDCIEADRAPERNPGVEQVKELSLTSGLYFLCRGIEGALRFAAPLKLLPAAPPSCLLLAFANASLCAQAEAPEMRRGLEGEPGSGGQTQGRGQPLAVASTLGRGRLSGRGRGPPRRPLTFMAFS
jgi:hypothetical protein